MTTIRQDDLIESIAAALQYISFYHPADFISHLTRAWEREQSPAAKDAMAQILTNSKMSALGHRPICQDTGIVNVFLKVGMNVRWEGFTGSLEDAINEGVRRGYMNPDNALRASVVADPLFARKNTKDNTPAVIFTEIVAGDKVDITVAAKGGGSENKSKMVMMNPSDNLVDWVLKTVPTMGAGWCPPGMLGIGIGGTAEKAVLLAKESLMDDLNMYELQAKSARGEKLDQVEELRLELFEKVNALGIGAQGLGGLTTVLDVKILDYPTHAASLPVAMIPNCAATRHVHFELDGSGPAELEVPKLEDWPTITWDASKARRVNLDTVTKDDIATPEAVVDLLGVIAYGEISAFERLAEDAKLAAQASAAQDGNPFAPRLIVNGQTITNFEYEQRMLFLQALRAPGDLEKEALDALLGAIAARRGDLTVAVGVSSSMIVPTPTAFVTAA